MATGLPTSPLDDQPLEIEPSLFTADDAEFSEVSTPSELARPWGPWATDGRTLLCFVVVGAAQVVGLLIFVVIQVATNHVVKFETLATDRTLAVTPAEETLALIGGSCPGAATHSCRAQPTDRMTMSSAQTRARRK